MQIVNAQASSWNGYGEAQFTLNLGVYFPSVAERLDGLPHTATPREADSLLRERIGFLMPGHQDQWWVVRVGAPFEAVAAAVRAAYLAYGWQWLQKFADLGAARAELERTGSELNAAAASLVLDEPEAATRILQTAIARFPKNNDRLISWGRANHLL